MNIVADTDNPRQALLKCDKRPAVNEGQEYPVIITNPDNERLLLEVSGVENFSEYEILLVNENVKNIYDLHNIGNISLIPETIGNYRLFIGTERFTGNIKSGMNPSEFKLHQNYPNPFNPVTRIRFEIPELTFTKIVLYNVLGKKIKTLVSGEYEPGTYDIEFDADGLASGVYFVRLENEKSMLTTKIVLMK